MFNSQQYPLNDCLFKIKIKYLHISTIVFKSYLRGFTFKNIIFRFSEFIEDKHIYWNLKFPLSALKMKIEKSISNVGTIKFEDKCLIPQFKLSLFLRATYWKNSHWSESCRDVQKHGQKSGLSINQKRPQWIFRSRDRY